MVFPSATLYPPVHENLSLYKRLLKNIPLKSGQDYQSFLDATSSAEDSFDASDAEAINPFHSTETSKAKSHSKTFFWKRFSMIAKKPAPSSLSRRNGQQDIAIPMSDLLGNDPLHHVAQAQALADQVDQAQVHSPPLTPSSLPAAAANANADADPTLNEIKTVR